MNNSALSRAMAKARPGAIDAETVIYRLEEAGKSLMSIPMKGGPAQMGAAWPSFAQDVVEPAKGGTDAPRWPMPSAGAITRMDEAICWASDHITQSAVRRIVLMRSLISPRTERHIHSWADIGKAVGAHPTACASWHSAGIDSIVRGLNRKKKAS